DPERERQRRHERGHRDLDGDEQALPQEPERQVVRELAHLPSVHVGHPPGRPPWTSRGLSRKTEGSLSLRLIPCYLYSVYNAESTSKMGGAPGGWPRRPLPRLSRDSYQPAGVLTSLSPRCPPPLPTSRSSSCAAPRCAASSPTRWRASTA